MGSKPTSAVNTINEIKKLINYLKHQVTIVWVPSRIGLKGNEQADSLATSAFTSLKPNIGANVLKF